MDPESSAILRTVAVGGLSKAELLAELQRNAVSLNAYAKTLFADDRFTTAPARHSLNTVELTVGALGFPNGATAERIFQQAASLGLELCPLELAPHLRLQYLDQPAGFWITIASQKISEDENFPNGFYLRRLDDRLWLRGYRATHDHLWTAAELFIFVQRHRATRRV